MKHQNFAKPWGGPSYVRFVCVIVAAYWPWRNIKGCRYITRPALGHKRLSRTRAGEVVLQLKTPYRDGSTHLVMTPLEFLQRLAALVPRPRLHLIRFHGVLAPNAALRAQIVPGEGAQAPNSADADDDPPAASPRARMSWAQLLKRVFAIDITTCPQCGGLLTIRAVIEDPAVIGKILTHLGLPTRAEARLPTPYPVVIPSSPPSLSS